MPLGFSKMTLYRNTKARGSNQDSTSDSSNQTSIASKRISGLYVFAVVNTNQKCVNRSEYVESEDSDHIN